MSHFLKCTFSLGHKVKGLILIRLPNSLIGKTTITPQMSFSVAKIHLNNSGDRVIGNTLTLSPGWESHCQAHSPGERLDVLGADTLAKRRAVCL